MDEIDSSLMRAAVRFSDIAEYNQTYRHLWEFDYRQIGRIEGQGRCDFLTDGRSTIYREFHTAKVSLHGGLKPGLIAFALPEMEGGGGIWQGSPLREYALAYTRGQKELDVVVPAGFTNTTVALPLAEFTVIFEKLSGCSLDGIFPPNLLFRGLGAERWTWLAGQWKQFVRAGFGGRPATVAVAETLARVCMEPACNPIPCRRRPVEIFREAMDRCRWSSDPLGTAGLALELGVSLRTLEQSFRATVGMPPARYLRYLRLNLAHGRLIQARPEHYQVTDIALDAGFTEFGRFAVEYRRLFGRRPSDTLRMNFPGAIP